MKLRLLVIKTLEKGNVYNSVFRVLGIKDDEIHKRKKIKG